MRISLGPRGLRARIMLAFGVGALLVTALLATTTFLVVRSYLLDQREDSLTHQAFIDANVLSSRLSTAGARVGDELGNLIPSGGADVVVRRGDAWYSSTLDAGEHDIPRQLQQVVSAGSAGTARTGASTGPRLVVGIPVVNAGVQFYELSPLTELQMSLRTLAIVLGAGSLTATVAGAAFGGWVSRRVVQPLDEVAGAATRIAGGELSTRLPATDDPDLVAIVASFNSMVDALSARIDRDARFVGDVSHELRSPLTSLLTSVEVIGSRRGELSPRAQEALSLVERELDRFRRMLDDLLELARIDGAGMIDTAEPVSLSALVREVLSYRLHPTGLLVGDPDLETVVRGDKIHLERAVSNLLDNADRHAGGACRVRVAREEGSVVVVVDDAGPGVPPADRERVFERFSRGAGAARRSLPGAGLGLAIVAETAARHGGAAWCSDSPGGGARFTLSIPEVVG